ncbi:hypothetical protein Tsubulata_037712, partial [Turnera subulata]
DNWTSVTFAMAGGVVLSLGNLSTQYAWAFVGFSLATEISFFFFYKYRDFFQYICRYRYNFELLPVMTRLMMPRFFSLVLPAFSLLCFLVRISDTATCKEAIGDAGRKNVGDESSISEVKFGTADFLVQLENRRAIKVSGKSTMIGLGITLFAGLCFSLFALAFNLATNDQLHTLKKGVPKLVVYTAFFWFSVSCFVLGIFLNVTFLYRPVLNLPRSSIKAYLKDWNGRGWALLAGFLCGFGNGLQFMGGQAAGYAAADVGQALPLVSTFWGILLFGEYRRSSRKTYGSS